MTIRRRVEVDAWGTHAPGTAALVVQPVHNTLPPTVRLYLPYMERAISPDSPPGAVHQLVLYPDEAVRTALALLEMAGVAQGAAPWGSSDG